MKKLIGLFMLIIIMPSCRHAWSEEDNKTFKTACLDDAKAWAGSQQNGEAYCNCVIRIVKGKYRDEDDAMSHIEMLSTDKDLLVCRDSVRK